MTVEADTAFLIHVSDTAFELGPHGFHLIAVTMRPRQFTCADTGVKPAPPAYVSGPPPESHQQRRAVFWQPAPEAPPYLHLAWLVNEIATELSALAEEAITVFGIDSPTTSWAELRAAFRDTSYRVRIGLAGRDEPLDFPGMYLREMFTAGRHRRYLATGTAAETPLIDLRGVL